MRSQLLVLSSCLALASAVAACDTNEKSTAPTIVNLQLEDRTIVVGVAVGMAGGFDVADPDGNLASMHLELARPDGSSVAQVDVPINGAGQTSGHLPITFDFTADVPGRHALTVWVVDADGQASNHLTTTTSEAAVGDPAPALSNLKATLPDAVYVGRPTTLDGTVDFVDVDGDLATLVVRVVRFDTVVLAEARVPVADVTGTVSGTAPFSIGVTADAVGNHTLEVSAEDSAGHASRAVTQTFATAESPTAPKVRNFDLADARAYVGIPTAMPVAFDFTDSDANITTLHVVIKAPDGTVALEREQPLAAAAGLATGAVAEDVFFTAPAAARYTMTVWVTDALGEGSNRPVLTFDAIVPSTTAPSVSHLTVDIPTVYDGKATSIGGTVDFSDVDGNVVALGLRVLRQDGTTLLQRLDNPAGLAGKTSGTLPFALDFTPDSQGLYSLDVWVEDQDGEPSTHAAKTFSVVVSPTAPALGDMDIHDARAYVGIPTVVPVDLAFTDSDANVSTFHVKVLSPSGAVALEAAYPLVGTQGVAAGTASLDVVFEAALAGRHTFEGWLSDTQGESSHHATRTFDATVPSTTAPAASALSVQVGNVLAGKPAALTGSVHWTDVDGNVTRLFVRLARPDGSTLAQELTTVTAAGTAGDLTFDLDFTPDAIGLHTLHVWVEDEDGQPSGHVTRSIDALESPTAPRLTDLDLSAARAYVGIPAALPAEVSFKDQDGNLTTLHVRITSPSGSIVLDHAAPLAAAMGLGEGTLTVAVPFDAPAAGRHTFDAWLEDAAGELSRHTSRTFDVVLASSTAPTASNLQTTATSFEAGKPATLSGSFAFADIDGNVATRFLRLTRLGGAVVVASASAPVAAATAGTATFELPFTADTIALHQLEAWVEDAEGQPSPHLVKLIDIVKSPTAPVASDLALPGAKVYVDVATRLPVTLSFADSDANVTTLHARVLSPTGVVAAELDAALPDAAGDPIGDLALDVPLTARVAGRHTIDVWLSDAAGELSNRLTLTFDATVASSLAPRAFGLTVDNATIVVGKPATIAGSLSFEDVDANLDAVVVRALRPGGSVLKEQRSVLPANGLTAGEVSFSIAVTPDVVGFHTLELWLEDEDDQTSARLTRGLPVETSPTAPVVSALDLGASRALVAVSSTLAGAIHFVDADSNVKTLHLKVLAPGGAVVLETTKDLAALAGQGSGDASFSQALTTTVEGRHTLESWIVDAAGETSAHLTRTFDSLKTSTTPTVSGLSVTVAGALWIREPATASGTLAFADVSQDVDKLFLRLTRPSGTVLVERQVTTAVTGQAAGSVAFDLDFTPDSAGRHVLEAWVVDAAGQASARESKSLDVIDTRPIVKRLSVVHDPLYKTKAATISGTVELADADGNPTKVVVQLVRPDGTAFPETEVALTNADGLTSASVSFVFAVTPDAVGTHTLAAWVVDADLQTAVHASAAVVVYDATQAQSACAALALDCAGEGFCYDVNSTTCDYFESHLLTPPDACDTMSSSGSVAMCVASTTDAASPLVTDSNRCKFVQYWSYPTDLPIDCRCPEARFDHRCTRPYEAPQALSYGTGPRIRALAGTFQAWRGTVVGREWLLPVKWSTFNRSNETMIFGIDLDTGNRRYFSGAYDDPATGYKEVGTGDKLLQVMDLKVGPDGQLYAVGAASDIAPPKLWRIDPVSGARTKIFDEETAAQGSLCPNYSSLTGRKVVQMAAQGFAMDGQGRFYFSNVGMPGPSILRLTVAGVGGASATSCEYLTRVMDCPLCTTQQDVGGGYDTVQFDMTAFEIEGQKLYTVSDKRFLEVDLATGDRRLLSLASDVGAIGTGPINGEGLADRWTTWDPWREVFWTVGILGGSMAVTVDPTTGDRAAWPCFHTSRGVLEGCGGTGMALVPGPLNFGGMVIDPLPPHDLFFAHDLMSIVKYEVHTGNSYVFSL